MIDEIDRASGAIQLAERTAEAAGLQTLARHFARIHKTIDALREGMLNTLREGSTRHRLGS